VNFDTFFRRAHEAFRAIPEEFRTGVDGLTVREEALPDPVLPDVYTLGQCLTEGYPSDWEGPETTRSVVVLYYGSFRALARLDPGFDWEAQLWETLTHELRHHLESLARSDALLGVDYALDQGFRRADGLEFDPFYYRSGDPVAPGVYQVEYDFFVEREWGEGELEPGVPVPFAWHGRSYEIPAPSRLGDVHFVWVRGVEVGPGALEVVLVRRRGWRGGVRALLRRESLEVLESEAQAREREET